MGVNAKIVEKAGAWYAYNGEKIGQAATTPASSCARTDLAREIENKVRESRALPCCRRPGSCPATKPAKAEKGEKEDK